VLRPGLQATATWVLFLLLISGTSPMRAAAGVGSCGPANERARPSQPEMSECLGDTCGEARDVRSALEAAPQRCRGKSCSSEAAKASAKTHIRRGQLTDAFGVLAELIRLDPTSIRPFLAEEEQTKAPPDPAEAVRFYQSRVDSARSKGDRLAEARALLDSAGSYQDRDEYDVALERYSRSAQYFLRAGDHKLATRALIGIAEVYQLIGDLDEAERWLKDALAEADAARDRNLQFRVQAMLASVAVDAEDWNDVTEYTRDALRHSQELLQAWAANESSTVSLPITPDGAVALQMLGEVEALSGHFESAIACSKVALALHRTAARQQADALGDVALDLYHLGLAYTEAGYLDDAWTVLGEASRIDEHRHDANDYLLLNAMGTVCERRGRLEEAVRFYNRATDVLEGIGATQRAGTVQVSVHEQALSFYLDGISALLKLQERRPEAGYTSDAFLHLERGRAQALLRLLREARDPRAGTLAEIKRALSEQYRPGRERHADLTAALSKQASILQAAIGSGSAKIQPHGTLPKIASVSDVQGLLENQTAILEYALGAKVSGDNVGALWVVTRESVRVHELRYPNRIEKLVTDYRKKLETPPPFAREEVESQRLLGEKLYRALLGPASRQIHGKLHLIIVPCGSLYYLPFEALIHPRARGNGAPLSALDYLGGTHAVSYSPSASVLFFLDEKERIEKARRGAPQLPLLAFGALELPVAQATRGGGGGVVSSFTPLPYSAREVNRIAGILGGSSDPDAVNLGERATKERFEGMDLSRYRILHFATHADAGDDVRFGQPTLVFSGNELLTMSDIFDLRLNAELVVLSACKTARGKLYQSEGLVGLTSAFLDAGSRAVVASLWRVNDQSTSLFMGAFYKYLKAGKPKAEALRLARNRVMKSKMWSVALGKEQSLASPFFWAPFILIGGPH